MVTLLIILLILAFISGAPLFAVMLGGAAIGAYTGTHGSFDSEFDGAVVRVFGVGTGDQSTVLSTIPLFIYAGYVLAEAQTADRLVRFANALLGWAPGGLAIVTICTCALFTVFTGGSGVTIIALGGVLLPALVKQGYPEKFSLGLIAGTGSVGLLFPPALPLFVYGTVYGLTQLDKETWDTGRFIFAGIVPGLVLIGMLSAVAVTVAIVRKLPRQRFNVVELGKSFAIALPELIIPFGVIGCLAGGFALPEVAAMTVVYVVLLETVALRQIKPRVLWSTSRECLAMVGAIFIIIFASTLLTDWLVAAHVPKTLVDWTQAHVHSKFVFLLAINLILLLVGTMMDIFSAIVIVLPLIAPIAKVYGVDPYHLGVIFLLNLEVGYLHPPVGLNLFITSVKFQRPITEVMWATMPFLGTMIVALGIITYVPQLTVVPPPPRTGNVGGLTQLVQESFDDVGSVATIPLTTFDGTPVVGADGTPITRLLTECKAAQQVVDTCEQAHTKPCPTTQSDVDTCKNLFDEVTKCRAQPTDAQACERTTVSRYVADNLQYVTVKTVALIDEDGKPLLGPDTQPIVKKFADCAAIKSDTDRDACRDLFIGVSNCSTAPEAGTPIDACTRDAISGWVTENLVGDEPDPGTPEP